MWPINSLFENEQKMDQKTWILRKRSIAVNSETGITKKGNDEEKLPYDKEAALEETVKNLHEQVACLLCECTAKDELMAEHMKTAQEAIIGREKAEEKLAILKHEREDMLQKNVAANARLIHLNNTLKNCKQHLSSLKNCKQQLELKYTEARKKLAILTIENAQLTKSLAKKDEIIEATADYHVLKQELKMRTLRADVANRKNQESDKLEAGRQRLRLLARKRIPGHAKTVDKRKSLMIKRLCEVEEENKTLKEIVYQKENEICLLKAEVAGNNNHLESENKIISLKMELERMNDHFENLKLINVDLDQQLSAAKLENKQVLEKVSVLEMELEDRRHHYEGLETTCLELQLQLATVSRKDEVREDLEKEGKLTNNKKLGYHRCSLRDHISADDVFYREDLVKSPVIKEVISTTVRKDVVNQALPIVLRKKYGRGTEFLRKLLSRRRRRGGNKKKLHVFATYHI